MLNVRLSSIYQCFQELTPRRIALVFQSFQARKEREDDRDVWRYDLSPREEVFKGQLLGLGIAHVEFSRYDLERRVREIKQKNAFDLCVFTGEPFYQLLRTASVLRKAKFRKPILLEITEEDAVKKSSVKTAERVAVEHGVVDLLPKLVYLRKTFPPGAPRTIQFDVPEIVLPPSEKIRRSVRPFVAVDVATPPARIRTTLSRIVRDTAAAKALKRLYDFKCQVCGLGISFRNSVGYAEVHHIQPLGAPHNGTDSHSNMLVLCPNHHAMFDFLIPRFVDSGTVVINEITYPLISKHIIGNEVIAYHNRLVEAQE